MLIVYAAEEWLLSPSSVERLEKAQVLEEVTQMWKYVGYLVAMSFKVRYSRLKQKEFGMPISTGAIIPDCLCIAESA